MKSRILIIVCILCSLIPQGTSAFFPSSPTFPERWEMSYDDTDALARRFDAMYDFLPDSAFTRITTAKDVLAWVNEVVPFFGYENIVDPEYSIVYPSMIRYEYAEDAEGHVHVLGETNCLSDEVSLNARYLNENSTLYEERNFLVVIIHELAHAQGICLGHSAYAVYDDEVSAQLATLEVMAAMINRGNAQVFGAFIDELRYMTLTAAHASAMMNDREADYDKLVEDLVDDPFEKAKFAKAERYWENDQEQYQHILMAYNYEPINAILSGLRDKTCLYRDIDIENFDPMKDIAYKTYSSDLPCINGVFLPINKDVFNKPLYIDDLAYIFEHAEEMAQGELAEQ